MSERTPSERAGHVAMLVFSALVAGSFSLGAMASNHIAPTALNAVRFMIAATILLGLAIATKRLKASAVQAPWRYMLLGGLFSAYFVAMFEGLKTASPINATAVFTLMPIMAAFFGWLILRQILTKRMALALALGGIGALWVIFRADFSSVLAFEVGRGEKIYFLGCISHAIYTPLVRKLNRGEPTLVSAGLVLASGAVILTIWGWDDLWATDWANLPPIVWITLAYIALVASALTTFLIQFSAMRLPASKVMAYTYLTPTWVILLELALGHGAPSGLVLGGISFTILALYLLLKKEST